MVDFWDTWLEKYLPCRAQQQLLTELLYAAFGEAGFQTDVTDTAGRSRLTSGYGLALKKLFCFDLILGFLGCPLSVSFWIHEGPDVLSLTVPNNVLFILTKTCILYFSIYFWFWFCVSRFVNHKQDSITIRTQVGKRVVFPLLFLLCPKARSWFIFELKFINCLHFSFSLLIPLNILYQQRPWAMSSTM